ncbi:MAG: NAD(P)/FAD-dependent oxidoreductase [Trebonia sp.]
MSETPPRTSAVVIGAGIVGNSLVHHLALLGWRDIVLVDKGPLPNPGGSTGHASNFIFPIEYSKMMFELTRYSTGQYKALGVFTESGGIEVARGPERMRELRRRVTQAKAWGIPAEHLTPAGVDKLVPYLDESVILGGAYFPTVGVVDSLRAGTLMREAAQASGALTVAGNTEVLDVRVSDGAVTSVVTTAGEIETGNVVIACGVWSPRVARLAGARLPLTPIVHQMISVGPIGLFTATTGEIAYPIVRDVDTGMYERQHGADMEVGSYAHRPILIWPDDIPSSEQAVRSPAELPFTDEDFDPQLAQALELMPELLGDERAGIRYAINGLISMTPDGHPLLGETPEVKGLWSAAASWIKEGPGCGRCGPPRSTTGRGNWARCSTRPAALPAGRPDRHEDHPGYLPRVRDKRGDPAHGRVLRREDDHRRQHRPIGSDASSTRTLGRRPGGEAGWQAREGPAERPGRVAAVGESRLALEDVPRAEVSAQRP